MYSVWCKAREISLPWVASISNCGFIFAVILHFLLLRSEAALKGFSVGDGIEQQPREHYVGSMYSTVSKTRGKKRRQ